MAYGAEDSLAEVLMVQTEQDWDELIEAESATLKEPASAHVLWIEI